MKRLNARSFLSGALTAVLLLGSAMGVYAASTGKSIMVYFNDIKLIVDEKQVTPMDGNGNVVEPFTYNGTTYLPVRAVGEALGKEVNWDAATQTVVIGKYERAESLYPDAYLWELDYLDRNGYDKNKETIKDNFGQSYSGYLSPAWANEGYVEYALNGKYTKLKSRLILKYDYRTQKRDGTFSIKVDGKTVKQINYVKAGEEPVDLEINLQGANRLRIESNGWYSNENAFVDAGLYK